MPTRRRVSRVLDDREYLRGIIDAARVDEVDGEVVGVTVSSDDFDWLCLLASEACRGREMRRRANRWVDNLNEEYGEEFLTD